MSSRVRIASAKGFVTHSLNRGQTMIDFVRTMTAKKTRRGAIALEYALVLAFVAVAVLAALVGLGSKLTTAIDTVGTTTTNSATSAFQAPAAP